MASHNPTGSSLDIRHHIQEITLQPETSKHRIELEIIVDGKAIHKLPSPEPGRALCWDMKTFPCDVRPKSKIGLKFIKNSRVFAFPDREVLMEYTILEAKDQTSITRHISPFPPRMSGFIGAFAKPNQPNHENPLIVTVKFPSATQVPEDNSIILAKANKLVEEKKGPLDRVGKARGVLNTILSFGEVVAGLHPIAALVVGLCSKAWEKLEAIQGQHDDMQALMEGLVGMQDFIEAVKGRAKEQVLLKTIDALLRLLRDTCNFIINTLSQTDAVRTMREFVATESSDKIAELLRRFVELKENFDRGVSVQVLNQVDIIAQRSLLKLLNPAARSHYGSTPPCQEGTRSEVIADIDTWARDSCTFEASSAEMVEEDLKGYEHRSQIPGTAHPTAPTTKSPRLLWLHGHAGMGKSSIASSVCQKLNDRGTLGATFFCKRDDPQLRTPEQILNTIIYNLASQYEPYGQVVASAIEGNTQLPDSPFGERYKQLVVNPLQTLKSAGPTPSGKCLVIVVDALDECERDGNRRLLINCLREMPGLVPWIQVLVTSRPDQDIEDVLGSTSDGSVDSRSLLDYDASGDIFMFTKERMSGIAKYNKLTNWPPEDLVRLLSTRAGGLFIWAETACKFIERGSNMNTRLKQVLADTTPIEGTKTLDALYTTAITQSMGDEGEDNVQDVRQCLGAIVTTARHTPLSVTSLESLLSSQIEPGVIRKVMNGLGSVLYEDQSRGGVVRVYHPSFADFILTHARSGGFYTDPEHQNEVLADCCLRTMMYGLKFNICGLETSHLSNRNIKDLEARVRKAIASHLAYSCMHWVIHLTEAPEGTLQDQLSEFLYSPKLFYWIEAMSLLGQLSMALASLLALVAWTSNVMEGQSKYANDAYRFILTFYDAISESTPHLYISALAFAPTKSKLAQRMRSLFPNTSVVSAGVNESWPSWLQTMSHTEPVFTIACSANGRLIISGSGDGTVRIWDSETGAAVSEPLKSPDVYRVAITSNEHLICSGSWYGILRVWNVETGAEICEPFGGQSDRNLASIGFCSNDRHIFSGYDDNTVHVWDAESGAELSGLRLNHPSETYHVALSPDGRHIASYSKDKALRVWDAETGALVTEPLTNHSSGVLCIAFSPNSRLLASGSGDQTVHLWDVSTGTAFHQPMIGHSDCVTSVAFSPNGRYLVSGSGDRTAQMWDVQTGMAVGEPLVGHAEPVRSVAFCSSGRRLVSASEDNTVRIWDIGTDLVTSPAPLGHSAPVTSVAFSPNSRYVASADSHKDNHDADTLCVWDAHTGTELFKQLLGRHRYSELWPDCVSSIVFTPDSRHIISLVSDRTVRVWDVETGDQADQFDLSHSDRVLSIALSHDGQRIASGFTDGTVGLWEFGTGAPVLPPLAGHSGSVKSVALSPDGRFIASGSLDRTVRIWDAVTGATVGEPLTGHLENVLSVCFSPNSRCIASGSWDETVRVWDTATGAPLLEPILSHSGPVYSVVFSSDGRYIISGSIEATVQIWDAETGAAAAEPLIGHSDSVRSVSVSPDGSRIISGSEDKSVRFWDFETALADPDLLISALRSAPSILPISTGFLACRVSPSGWVTSSDGALLLWLPKDRRYPDKSIIQISANPFEPRASLLDFSKFVHGDSWALVSRA